MAGWIWLIFNYTWVTSFCVLIVSTIVSLGGIGFGTLGGAAFGLLLIGFGGVSGLTFFLWLGICLLVGVLIHASLVKQGFRALLKLLFGLSTISIAISLYFGMSALPEINRIKRDFPIQDGKAELVYEVDKPRLEQEFHPEAENSRFLKMYDSDMQQETRIGQSRMLHQLHEKLAIEFSLAAGFGPDRVPSVRFSLKRLEPVPEFKLLVPTRTYSGQESGSITAIDQETESSLNFIHINGVFSFLDVRRMGYVYNDGRTIGFESHAFTRPIEETKEWRVARLELMSLLRHETPRVYVSENLPRMDQLKEARTRDLTDFEASALSRIQTGVDKVVIEAHAEKIYMAGAIRASATCQKCHSVKFGELLGVFSYELDSKLNHDDSTPMKGVVAPAI